MSKMYFIPLILSVVIIGFSVAFVIGTSGESNQPKSNQNSATEKATFAGGCFWCMEPPFENLDGVTEVFSGYTGGQKKNPTYEEVSSGGTGHAEVIQILYDPQKVSYAKLLDLFWKQIDPTDSGGQFVDRGTQYRTAIFYHNGEQKRIAEKSLKELNNSGRYKKPVATQIIKFQDFYKAEDYHQDYYRKSPLRYKMYKYNSGREQYLEKVWSDDMKTTSQVKQNIYQKPDNEKLKKKLSPLQYKVTQESCTEKAFDNEYWNNKKEGIYVDIVSGEPLFSSLDKFDSGTGWPSFSKPLDPGNIVKKDDRSLFMVRTEVRSKEAGSHLGHLFPDGPKPTGERYCINSASIRFIPKENLKKEGYGKYKELFKK